MRDSAAVLPVVLATSLSSARMLTVFTSPPMPSRCLQDDSKARNSMPFPWLRWKVEVEAL